MRSEDIWEHAVGDDPLGCWEWQRGKTTAGYGHAYLGKGGERYVHRLAWEQLRGEIPDGLVIDHLCRNRACMNPWHMEPVTQSVNASRGHDGRWPQTCPKGHSEWRMKRRQGRVYRDCAVCHRDRERQRRKGK